VNKKKAAGKPRIQNQGLVAMNFQVPPKLYQQVKLKVVRKKVTLRALAEALLTGYVKGEISFEEKKVDSEGD